MQYPFVFVSGCNSRAFILSRCVLEDLHVRVVTKSGFVEKLQNFELRLANHFRYNNASSGGAYQGIITSHLCYPVRLVDARCSKFIPECDANCRTTRTKPRHKSQLSFPFHKRNDPTSYVYLPSLLEHYSHKPQIFILQIRRSNT